MASNLSSSRDGGKRSKQESRHGRVRTPAPTETSESHRGTLYTRSRALVLGASNYQHDYWRVLPGVVDDVREVSAALEEHGFEVKKVLDPDQKGMEWAFKEFLLDGSIDKSERLLVYYAGHGFTDTSPQGVKTGYILPVDAVEPGDKAFGYHVLDLDTVHIHANRVKAHHVLFLFDSCFSGELLESCPSRGAPPPYIEAKARRPVRQFITSGQADESVPDHSIFRKHFVLALQGAADRDEDGFFTASQLYDYLFGTVVTKSEPRQHPQYGKSRKSGLDKGDFIFEVPAERLAARVQARIPDPPPPRPDFSPFRKAAAETQGQYKTRRQQWGLWVQNMEKDLQEAIEFEQQDIPLELKAPYWVKFLQAYSAEMPSLDIYADLREKTVALQEEAIRRLGALEAKQTRSKRRKAVHRPGQPREFSPLKIRFRSILPGEFLMGSPEMEKDRHDDEQQHSVHLTRGFWISETPITQGQWKALMNENPSHFSNGGDDCPVERVNWYSAVLFCNRLSKSADLESCYELIGCSEVQREEGFHCQQVLWTDPLAGGFRLPTEAEWEFAARAGTQTTFWTGDDLDTASANFDGNFPYRGPAQGTFRQRTTSVRKFEPNPWGLFDIHGNVAEWVWDLYASYTPERVFDPLGGELPSDASFNDCLRSIRGGGWLDDAGSCRTADRLPAVPGYRDSNLGFRVALNLHTSPGASEEM